MFKNTGHYKSLDITSTGPAEHVGSLDMCIKIYKEKRKMTFGFGHLGQRMQD